MLFFLNISLLTILQGINKEYIVLLYIILITSLLLIRTLYITISTLIHFIKLLFNDINFKGLFRSL